jgi:flagellar hook-associated protein 2
VAKCHALPGRRRTMPEIGAITFGGLVTGLDTKTLITQLVSLARQPIQRLEQTRSQEEKKVATFQDFNSKLLALKTASEKLLNSTNFFSRTSTVSDDTALGAAVTSSAQAGNYTITIDQLARVGQQTFAGIADKTTQTLAGTFAVNNAATNPTNFAISINIDGMSLDQLRDAINNDTNNNGKVTATILDTGSGTQRYRLQVKGNTTGTTNDFNVTSTASLSKDTSASVTFSAIDATFNVDGVTITRSRNIISDVIDGATLTFKSKTTEPVTLSISNDVGTIQNNIESFVSSYNDIRSYANSKSTLDQKNPQNNGPFLGDATVRGIYARLQQLMTDAVSGLTGDLNALNDIGITTGTDGKLAIDKTKLSDALATNTDSVSKIFIGNAGVSGVAVRVKSELTNFTNPIGGLIDVRVDGIQARITGLNDRIDVMERRMTSYESTLVRQFTALERLVGSLQTQGIALGSIRV